MEIKSKRKNRVYETVWNECIASQGCTVNGLPLARMARTTTCIGVCYPKLCAPRFSDRLSAAKLSK